MNSTYTIYGYLITAAKPGSWFGPMHATFLESVRQWFELSVQTHGSDEYARAVCAILDPGRMLFGDRIFARELAAQGEAFANGVQCASLKSLDRHLGMAAANLRLLEGVRRSTLVVDDRVDVWVAPEHPNVLQIARFWFFDGECECDAIGPPLPLPAATPGQGRHDDYLLRMLHALVRCKDNTFLQPAAAVDVRLALDQARCHVLPGCRLLFSGLIPLDQRDDPMLNPYWEQATRYGAACFTDWPELCGTGVTHVVSHAVGTRKVWEAAHNSRIHLVHVQ